MTNAAAEAPVGGVPPGTTLRLRGRGTTFVRDAPGPPGAPVLFLLHGLGATGAVNWFACFPALSQDFRVIAIDQRGHGRGIRTGLRGFRLEDCADDVIAVADALEIDRVIPVGYSMGGPVAQLVWQRHSSRVRGLVLCATARNFRGTPRPDMTAIAFSTAVTAVAGALRLVPAPVRREVVHARVARRVPDPQWQRWMALELGEHDPSSLLEAARAVHQFSSAAWISDVNVPTAVVVTTEDTVVPPSRQRKLAEAIPNAVTVEVAGDHVVCGARPDRFVPGLVSACRAVAH